MLRDLPAAPSPAQFQQFGHEHCAVQMIVLCALTACCARSIVGTQLHVDGVVDGEPDECIKLGAASELCLGAAPELQNVGAAPEVLKAEADQGAPRSPAHSQPSPIPSQPSHPSPHSPAPSHWSATCVILARSVVYIWFILE